MIGFRKQIFSGLLSFISLFFWCDCASTSDQKKTGKSPQILEKGFPFPPPPKIYKEPLTVLNDPERSTKERREAAAQLIVEDAKGTAKTLLEVCTQSPELLTPEMMNYFGEKSYYKAAPLIKEALAPFWRVEGNVLEAVPQLKKALKERKEPEFIYNGFFALLQMDVPKATAYVLSYCASEYSYRRFQCLLAVYDTENKYAKKQAIPVFKNILRNKSREPKKTVTLARDFLSANTAYRYRPKKQSSRPTTKKFKTQKKKRISAAEKVYYKHRLLDILEGRLSFQKAASLVEKIDHRLKAYAQQKSDVSRFVVRSYRIYYRDKRLSAYEAKKLMKKGVEYPGSLHAVVKNIEYEYHQYPMRVYSLSIVFDISRLEARLLLKLLKKYRAL